MAKPRNIWKTNILTTCDLNRSNGASYVTFDRVQMQYAVQGALDSMHNH